MKKLLICSPLACLAVVVIVVSLSSPLAAQCCSCCEGYYCCEPATWAIAGAFIDDDCSRAWAFKYQFESCSLETAYNNYWVFGDATGQYINCQCDAFGAGHPRSPSCGSPAHDTAGWVNKLSPIPLGGGHAWELPWQIVQPTVSYSANCAPGTPCYDDDGENEIVTYSYYVWSTTVGCPCN
jgi:hypothetical protein